MDGNRITNLDERRSSMKIYKLVNVLGALNDTGKLASDMYELGKKRYYSKEHQQEIPVSEMDFQHMVRAFVKQNDEDVRVDTQEGKVKELEKQLAYYKNLAEANFISSVNDSEISDTWKQKYERELESSKFWRDAYDDVIKLQGKGYVFSEITNDTDGQEFVDKMKKHLNRTSYKMRVRGQHIKPELRGTGATYWGQNLDESTHMRIYIEAKKGE